MKVLALNGSPKRNKSYTMLILDSFLHGLHDAGATVELVHLVDLQIKPCIGCLDCWFKTPGQCRFSDSMDDLLRRLRETDIWVLATGVYWSGPTGLLKNAMDRMLPLMEPTMEMDRGRTRNKRREGTKAGKFVLVSSCGYWERDGFDILIAQMKSFCDQLGREYSGALLRPHGLALPHLMWQGRETGHILRAAKEAGRMLVQKGSLSEDIQKAVSAELLPLDGYIKHANDTVRKILAIKSRYKDSDNRLEVTHLPSPFKLEASPNRKLSDKIVDTINRMGGIGIDAEKKYQEGLRSLRESADKVIPVLEKEYWALPEAAYVERWSLVYLLGELSSPAALDELDRIIDSPIPKEKSKVLHEYSTRAEELMIRTTAVESIKKIAASNNPDALKLLLKQVRHEYLSVRRAAVQAYLEIGGRDAKEKLMKLLPETDRRLLELKKLDVREILQPLNFDVTEPPAEVVVKIPPRFEEIPPDRKKEKPVRRKPLSDNDDTPQGRS